MAESFLTVTISFTGTDNRAATVAGRAAMAAYAAAMNIYLWDIKITPINNNALEFEGTFESIPPMTTDG